MSYKLLNPVYNLGKGVRKYLGLGVSGESDVPETIKDSVEGRDIRPDYKAFQTQLSVSGGKVQSTKERLISSIPKIENGDSYFAPESLFERTPYTISLS